MEQEVLQEFKGNVEKALASLKSELSKVRTGRANLAILDGIRVEYYGTPTPLNQVASLAVADPRLITIKPWEKSLCAEIEKSIKKSDLGLNPASDGELVRVPIPALTEERRRDLTKVIKRYGEDAKVAIRNHRRDSKELLEGLQKDGDISEDVRDRALKDLQTHTDAGVAKVDDLITKKEKELMEV
jgi:ribosome recycling factor